MGMWALRLQFHRHHTPEFRADMLEASQVHEVLRGQKNNCKTYNQELLSSLCGKFTLSKPQSSSNPCNQALQERALLPLCPKISPTAACPAQASASAQGHGWCSSILFIFWIKKRCWELSASSPSFPQHLCGSVVWEGNHKSTVEEFLHPSLLIWGSHLIFLPDLKLSSASVEAENRAWDSLGLQQGSVRHMFKSYKHFLWIGAHYLALPESALGMCYGPAFTCYRLCTSQGNQTTSGFSKHDRSLHTNPSTQLF